MANTFVSYRDLDLNFTRHPVTHDVSQLTDTEAIKRSVRNLLMLKRGDKPFHPEINSGIYDSLFDLVNPLNVVLLRDNILRVIQTYEKRVKLTGIDVRPNLGGNEISIHLKMTVITSQAPINFTVNLVRSR